MDALRKISDIVLCNVLFCGLCLPIFTAGAAYTGLLTAMQLLSADMDDEGDAAVKAFLRGFKNGFKKSLGLFLISILSVAFLFAYRMAIMNLAGTMGKIYSVTFYLLSIIILIGLHYAYPIHAKFDLKIKDIIKNSYSLSIAAMPYAFGGLLMHGVLLYISLVMNPFGLRMTVFFWVVCGFGMVNYLDSFLFFRALKKCGVNLGLI